MDAATPRASAWGAAPADEIHQFNRLKPNRSASMNEPLPLRRARPTDAKAVRALTRAAYASWVPHIGREPKPMTADYERAVVEHIIELWEEAGELLAMIEVIPEADFLMVENIAVRPDQQGRGVGERLLHHAEQLARSLGFDQVQLYTNSAFASNLQFYARRGYREFQRVTVAPGSVAVHMGKWIG
jgi:N-acetylglutamate synthase-like GNAT family acetyltransferase